MNRQPSTNTRDARETLRWIERARCHIAELERDPRRLKYMQMATEIRRGVQEAGRSLAEWHVSRTGSERAPVH